jgi:hypothetical protein
MGTCDGAGCGCEIRRGDPFVVTLSQHLVCYRCWQKPCGEWLGGSKILEDLPPGEELKAARREDIAAVLEEHEEAQAKSSDVIDQDYGPDNPLF